MASEERGPEVVMPPPLIYLAPLVGGLILDRLIPLPRLPRRLTRPAGVEELLVVVQVETVEVSALPAAGLSNPQNLPAPHF